MVGAVHLGAYGRWDRIPDLAVGCVLVAALLGLLGRIAWVRSGEAAPVRTTGRPHANRK